MAENGAPVCPHCGATAILVLGKQLYPHRPDLGAKVFWLCPPCKAHVGCHPGTSKPLGAPSNAELRRAKMAAHDAFDKLWISREPGSRGRAYQWLADHLGIPKAKTHIGWFDIETCRRVVEICARIKEIPCKN